VPRPSGVSPGRSPGSRIRRRRAPSRMLDRRNADPTHPVVCCPGRPRSQWRGPRGIHTRFPIPDESKIERAATIRRCEARCKRAVRREGERRKTKLNTEPRLTSSPLTSLRPGMIRVACPRPTSRSTSTGCAASGSPRSCSRRAKASPRSRRSAASSPGPTTCWSRGSRPSCGRKSRSFPCRGERVTNRDPGRSFSPSGSPCHAFPAPFPS